MFVDFIIPSIGNVNHVKCILASLMSQTDDDWSANVILDDEHSEEILSIIKSFNTEKISYNFMGKRVGDFGHTPREIGKQMSTADYIIMTGDDNYYVPKLVEEMKIVATSNPVLIYWNMVHNHRHYNTKKHYQCWETLLVKCGVDIGSFATRRDVAQNFHIDASDFSADGKFIEDIKEHYDISEFIGIDKILYVHN